MCQTMVLTLQLAGFLLAISQVQSDGSSCGIQILVGLCANPKRLWTSPRKQCTLTCSMGHFERMVNCWVVCRMALGKSFVMCVHVAISISEISECPNCRLQPGFFVTPPNLPGMDLMTFPMMSNHKVTINTTRYDHDGSNTRRCTLRCEITIWWFERKAINGMRSSG